MRVEQVVARFKTLNSKGVVCFLNGGENLENIRQIERKLDVQFPDSVTQFWGTINGLEVTDPQLSLFPLSRMSFDDNLLIFGICNGTVRLAFNTTMKNVAGEWSIVNAETRYRITYTMQSFWSIHIWTWIVKRRPIWFDAHAPQVECD